MSLYDVGQLFFQQMEALTHFPLPPLSCFYFLFPLALLVSVPLHLYCNYAQ